MCTYILFHVVGSRAGLEVLCRGLARNHTLQTLDLENKGVGAVGCRALGQVLERESGLSNLKLARNTLDDEAVQALCQVWVVGVGFSILAAGIKVCSMYGFACLMMDTANVQGACGIRQLDLSQNSFGQGGAEALARWLAEPRCPILHLDLSANGNFGAEVHIHQQYACACYTYMWRYP